MTKNFAIAFLLLVFDSAILAAPTTTEELYKGNGAYTANRRNLHDEILSRWLSQGRSAERPVLLVLAGAPGSGKTFVIDELTKLGLIDPSHFLNVSADLMKEELPEYWKQLEIDRRAGTTSAASIVHKESVHLRSLLFDGAIELNKNILFETTFTDRRAIENTLVKLRKDMPLYKIVLVHVKAKIETELARVKARGQETGRYVSEQDVRYADAESERAFNELRGRMDYSFKVSNDSHPYLVSVGVAQKEVKLFPTILSTWDGRNQELSYADAGFRLIALARNPERHGLTPCDLLQKSKPRSANPVPAKPR